MKTSSLLLLLAVAALCAGSASAYYCRVSGDPHWTTWDGVRHDYQGEGVYRYIHNDYFEVQTQTLHCNPRARTRVVCIRKVYVKIRVPSADNKFHTIVWGQWGSSQDAITIDGTDYSVRSFREHQFDDLEGQVTYIPSQRRLVIDIGVIGRLDGPKIIIGRYFLFAEVRSRGWLNTGTNGLCGTLSGDAADEFTDRNGTRYVDNVRKGGRYNTKAVYQWGATWAASDSGAITPIASVFHAWHPKTMSHMTVQATPTAVEPTDAEREAMDKVEFKSYDAVQAVENKCKAVSGDVGDQGILEDCIYDATALDDFSLASANVEAQLVVQEETAESDSGLSAAGKVGLALGLVAGVSVIVTLFLALRLRKVKAQYSQALIARNVHGDAGMQMSDVGDNI
eukprot:TRINITY_DN66402_c8_g1_i1.p1 TRINITY_DN66402_c8_g1~~TRINITY_DN66402_c8_g1_i1.p1  ORF type:complete len:395 (-),score=222.73 TRINITY_DN66402_c8_g1_i1:129-1313(-)